MNSFTIEILIFTCKQEVLNLQLLLLELIDGVNYRMMHDFNEMLLLLVLLIRGLINLKKKNMKLMNRLFTCKIKEHKDFTLAPLAPLWRRWDFRAAPPPTSN